MGDVASLGVLGAPRIGPYVSSTSNVRRCLFGAPDRVKTQEFIEKVTDSIYEEDCGRWNFDFRAGKPSPGRYEWTLVTSDKAAEKEDKSSSDEHTTEKGQQTLITDFMRKRKSSCLQEGERHTRDTPPKKRRRNST